MKPTNKTNTLFVICLNNQDAEDLQLGKVYQVLGDESAAQDDYLRVVDDSGEDYLYPKEYFAPITLPKIAERVLFPVAGD